MHSKDRDILYKLARAIRGARIGIVKRVTVEGNPASFTTNVVDNLIEMQIPFSLVQDLHGYEYPWVGGAGKNLIPYVEAGKINPSTGENSTEAAGSAVRSGYIPVKASTVYTFSGVTGNVRFFQIGDTGVINNTVISVSSSTQITTLSNAISVRFQADSSVVPTTANVQFEEGSTATPYAPYYNICPISGWTGCNVTRTNGKESTDPDYISTTYTISWQSAGTVYNATLKVNEDGTGVLTLEDYGLKLSDLSWDSYSSPSDHVFRADISSAVPNAQYPSSASIETTAITDAYRAIAWTPFIKTDHGRFALSPASVHRIAICDHNYSTVETFITARGNDTIVIPLATPVTYNLTAQQIKTLKGVNKIWSDTNGQNTIIYKWIV